MKIRKITLALLAVGSLAISTTAFAGPPVNITFKHLGASNSPAAEYTIISQNESLTYAYSSPKPRESVDPGDIDAWPQKLSATPEHFAKVSHVLPRTQY